MEAYIEIDGKRAKLTEEQLKALGLKPEKKNPFEMEGHGKYFFIAGTGNVCERYGGIESEDHYSAGNYCTDKELMKQRALQETLNRLLWRYSMEHGGDEITWYCFGQFKHYITYNYIYKEWVAECEPHVRDIGAPYFATPKAAQDAIEEIIKPFIAEHPEFKW